MPDYTQLLTNLAEHGNLSRSCRELNIVRTTFLLACDNDADLADKYTRAKKHGIDRTMEDLLDDPIEDASKSRLEWDRKRWHASKTFPKSYGDKVDVTSGGEKLDWTVAAAEARARALKADESS